MYFCICIACSVFPWKGLCLPPNAAHQWSGWKTGFGVEILVNVRCKPLIQVFENIHWTVGIGYFLIMLSKLGLSFEIIENKVNKQYSLFNILQLSRTSIHGCFKLCGGRSPRWWWALMFLRKLIGCVDKKKNADLWSSTAPREILYNCFEKKMKCTDSKLQKEKVEADDYGQLVVNGE